MDFPRDSYNFFNTWRQSQLRKPLLLRGARQVGKSYAVRTWGKRNFGEDNFVEINLEEKPQLKTIFEKDSDPDRIIDDLNFTLGKNLRKPNVLLFIDEIQFCPQAITALRYFYEKHPELYVIAAGSLIEFVLAELSFPVGRIESHFMFPLTFIEFLEAIGKSHLKNFLISHNLTEPVMELVHQELLSLLRFYCRIGGMPEAISAYLQSKDFGTVSRVHSVLLQSYEDDFNKYAKKTDWDTLISTYKTIPSFVCRGNLKYSHIDSNVRGEKIKKCVNLLEHARILSKIVSTTASKLPLVAASKRNIFKILFLDVGLLQHAMGFDWRELSPEAEITTICDGAFAEQFIGQELLATRSLFSLYSLHYWQRNKHGSEAEVDYIVEHNNNPCPLEIKSGVKGSLRSLHRYIEELKPERAFVLSQQNISNNGIIAWLPLYLAGRIHN